MRWRIPRAGGRLRDEDALRKALFERYRKAMGRSPDLEPPALFSERLLWLRLYARDLLAAVLADRRQQFEYVRAKAFERALPEVYGAYGSYREVPFAELPEAVSFRPTHLYGEEIALAGRNEADVRASVRRMKEWTKRRVPFETGDWEYEGALPGISAEAPLPRSERLRVLCLGGAPCALYRSAEPETLFSADGQILCGPKRTPPEGREEALSLSRALSEGFTFLRWEFAFESHEIRFAELRFTEEENVMRLWPGHVDRELGSLLPIKKRE